MSYQRQTNIFGNRWNPRNGKPYLDKGYHCTTCANVFYQVQKVVKQIRLVCESAALNLIQTTAEHFCQLLCRVYFQPCSIFRQILNYSLWITSLYTARQGFPISSDILWIVIPLVQKSLKNMFCIFFIKMIYLAVVWHLECTKYITWFILTYFVPIEWVKYKLLPCCRWWSWSLEQLAKNHIVNS